MPNRRQQFGKKSERLAVEYLKLSGYRILETNYRSTMGEIDIIASEKGTIVFVEVKARRSSRFGNPKSAVTPAKQRKISMAALDYLKQAGKTGVSARFDVVAIGTAAGETTIEVVKNAFDLAYG
jgi:putative endonuclease